MHFYSCTLTLGFAIALLSTGLSFGDDRIWLNDTKVEGKPAKFVFDSGANDIALVSDAVRRLGLRTNGAPSGDFGVTDTYTMEWDGNSFRTVFDVLNISGADFDGVMGWGPISSNISRIDANALKITNLPEVPKGAKNWAKYRIMTDYGTLDIEVPHSDGTTGVVTFDTGSDCGLALSASRWLQWKKVHPHSPATIITYATLNGFVSEEESWANRICIGPLVLTDVPIMKDRSPIAGKWGAKHDATLGLAALSRLDIVVDGIHSVAYLKSRTAPSRPYYYNRLGAGFVPADGDPHKMVATVLSGSPAYEAGVRDGDFLLQVDNRRVAGWTGDWASRFKMPAGTKVRLKLQRNGTNFETTAVLREILHPGEHFADYPAGGDSLGTAGSDSDTGEEPSGIDKKTETARNYYNWGHKEIESNDLAGALANFNKAIEADPQFAPGYAARGYVEQGQTNLNAAISDYDKAIELDPDYADAYGDRAAAKQAKGDLAGALVDYSKAIALMPDYAEAYPEPGYVEQIQGNMDAAIADYDKAIKLKSGYAGAYADRASVEQAKGNLTGALADYDKAIELNPDDAEAYVYRASAEAANSNSIVAIADYSKAIEIKPGYAEAYYYRGGVKADSGDLGGALADYNKAIALKPDWAIVYFYRAEVETAKGDLGPAEMDSAVAAGLIPNMSTNFATEFELLGWCRYNRQEFANALRDFQRASELNSSDDYMRFGIWLSNSRLGDLKGATENLRTYLATRQANDSQDWPFQIGRFLTSQITDQELLTAAESADAKKSKEQHCEAYFYIGSKDLIAGDKAAAASSFEKCVAPGTEDVVEYQSAKAELKALEKEN